MLLAEGTGTVASWLETILAIMSTKEGEWAKSENESTNNRAPPAYRPSRYTEVGDDMVTQLQRLGQKTGKGCYDYDPAILASWSLLPSIAWRVPCKNQYCWFR
jgi:hypothetical protein